MTSESFLRIQRNTLHHGRLDLEKSVSYPALKLDPTVDTCSWFHLIWMPVERCTLALDGGAEVINCSQRSFLVPHVPKVRAVKRT